MPGGSCRNCLNVRIAFFTTVYDHARTGGGTFVQYLRRAVREGLIDITFFSDDIEVERECYERALRVPAWARSLPAAFLVRGKIFERAFLEDHQKRPFDVVWHNNVLTSWRQSSARLHVPVVGMVNDASNLASRTPWSTARDLGSYRAFVRFVWRFAESSTARRASRLVVNSNFLQRAIEAGYKIPPERVALLYKAVALEMFRYEERSINRDRLRVLFVKSNYTLGGLPDLLSALARIPQATELTVVGPQGDDLARIREMARTRGYHGKLRLVGSLSRKAIVPEFAAHDVLCVPSRSEALGVAFLEALASGLPAIGTAVGGIPEVLAEGRAGWLVRPHDPESIAEALRAVVARDEERLAKMRFGREHVRKFTYERMIQRMQEIAAEAAQCR